MPELAVEREGVAQLAARLVPVLADALQIRSRARKEVGLKIARVSCSLGYLLVRLRRLVLHLEICLVRTG